MLYGAHGMTQDALRATTPGSVGEALGSLLVRVADVHRSRRERQMIRLNVAYCHSPVSLSLSFSFNCWAQCETVAGCNVSSRWMCKNLGIQGHRQFSPA